MLSRKAVLWVLPAAVALPSSAHAAAKFQIQRGYLFANGAVVVGPFATVECGAYTSGLLTLGSASVQLVDEVGPHFWFTFGVRIEVRDPLN